MKKTFLFLVITTLSFSSFSQSRTSFGLRGSVNICRLTNSDLDSKTGMYLGVFAQIKISNLYALQPELGYSNQGGEAKNALDENTDIHYISISATNNFFIKDSGFHFIIAPGFDFDTDDTFIGLSNRSQGNKATFIDVTIAAGIGIELENGLGIEARYKQGLVDVFSGNFHNFDSEQYESENQFNTVFQLGITYQFKF